MNLPVRTETEDPGKHCGTLLMISLLVHCESLLLDQSETICCLLLFQLTLTNISHQRGLRRCQQANTKKQGYMYSLFKNRKSIDILGWLSQQSIAVQVETGECIKSARNHGNTGDAVVLILNQAEQLHHTET